MKWTRYIVKVPGAVIVYRRFQEAYHRVTNDNAARLKSVVSSGLQNGSSYCHSGLLWPASFITGQINLRFCDNAGDLSYTYVPSIQWDHFEGWTIEYRLKL